MYFTNKFCGKLISFCVVCSIFVCFSFVIIKAKISYAEYSLINKIIFIDPGHGGKDNGAGVDGVIEDNINLNISKYLMEILINNGAQVFISRTGDYDLASLYQSNRKREDLSKRVKYINKIKPDIFLSIHLNTFSLSSVKGAQVFFQKNDKSKKLADCVQNRLNMLTKENKKTKIGDYFILNNSDSVGVLIECGFLSNQKEREKLNNEKYQKKIANKVVEGVVDYFNM